MNRPKSVFRWLSVGCAGLAFSAALYCLAGYFTYWSKSLHRTAGAPDALESVDPAGLSQVLDHAERAHSDAVVIIRDGKLIGAWHAGRGGEPIEAMSVTKSIVSLAIGRVMTLGLIETLDDPVSRYFPEWDKPSHRQITLRHILSHSSGLECLPNTSDIYEQDDFVKYALRARPVHSPGLHFEYNNRQTNLLPAVVEVTTGQKLDAFLRDDLFAALGITNFDWVKDGAGNPHGMSGLQILPEDLAKIGMLVVDRGRVAEQQLIDDGWFTDSFTATPSLPATHGLLWWLRADDAGGEFVKADGYLGQYLVIYPSKRLVGVRMYRVGFEHGFTYNDEVDGYGEFASDLGQLVR